MDFRQKLLEVHSEAEFKNVLLKHAQDLAAEQSNPANRFANHDADIEFPVRHALRVGLFWPPFHSGLYLYLIVKRLGHLIPN